MQISKFGLIVLMILAFALLYKCTRTEAATAQMTVSATVVASPVLGKKIFDAQCVDCHEASDYAGATVADLEKSLTVPKMKNIKLSLKQMQDLEAYLKTL